MPLAVSQEEKKLWHSHRYEVSSGVLYGPNLPAVAEKEVMKEIQATYGKTWHTWQVDRGDPLPLGRALASLTGWTAHPLNSNSKP